MTGIEREQVEQQIAELKERMKRRNRDGGIGASCGLTRMANELARLMERLNAS
jgi:hypothetical protein